MAIRKLQKYGDAIAVLMDDGSRVLCYPTPGGLWYPTSDVGAGPVDPDNPGGSSPFKWPMNPSALNTRNGRPQDGFMTAGRPTHNGVDMSFPPAFQNGMPIRAIADGTVVRAYWEPGGGGWYVELDHGRFRSGYAHGGTDENSTFQVSDGQTILQGAALMNAGSTGNSTGPHLHFQISDMNISGSFWTSSIDPEAFMAQYNPNDEYV